MRESNPDLVVIAPDLLGASLVDAAAGEVLQRWRNGRLRPAVNRALLIRYFKLLRQMGISDVLIRRWGWWFGSDSKALFFSEVMPSPATGMELCEALARASQAVCILCRHRPSPRVRDPDGGDNPAPAWMTAEEWLARSAAPNSP